MTHLAAGTLTVAELRSGIARTWDRLGSDGADVTVALMPWEEECIELAHPHDVMIFSFFRRRGNARPSRSDACESRQIGQRMMRA